MYQIAVINRKLNILDNITELEDLKALFQKQILWALDKNNNLQQQVQDGWNVLKDTEFQLIKKREKNVGLKGIIDSNILNENNMGVGRKKQT